MTTFVVAGSATKSHPAERGTVSITVGFSGPDRGRVRSDSIDVHAAVTDEAKAHADSGAAVDWTAERVSTSAFREYVKDSDETVVRYRAASTVTVAFADFGALADWVSDLAERPGVAVDDIAWSLTDEVRASLLRDVRVEAVQDAITKANDYAAALDRGSPTLDAVFEEGLRPNVDGGGGGGFARASLMMKGSPDGSYALKPADIEVTASISADFTM